MNKPVKIHAELIEMFVFDNLDLVQLQYSIWQDDRTNWSRCLARAMSRRRWLSYVQ